jgi:hypothetical protein
MPPPFEQEYDVNAAGLSQIVAWSTKLRTKENAAWNDPRFLLR